LGGVGLLEIEKNRNMVPDVELLDHSSRGRRNGEVRDAVRGSRGGIGVSRGVRHGSGIKSIRGSRGRGGERIHNVGMTGH
jgi:hypothetical protein